MRVVRFAALVIALAAMAFDRQAQAQAIPAPPNAGANMGTDIAVSEAGTRLTVPVAIGATGPYPFVIDTGAERTVVSRHLATQLGLSPGQPVSLTSMIDRSLVQTVVVHDLAIQSIGRRHTVHAPALDARDLGAVGMLGIDTLSNHKVLIDFDTGVMTVDDSEAPMKRRKRDEIVVSGRSKFGQLIVTNAFIGGTRIQVVIDTGTQISIGNTALLRLIDDRSRKSLLPTVITSVTGAHAPATYAMVRGIRIDGIVFGKLPVAFGDVEPFRHFDLMERPALLLGMDALRSFRRVEIDFPNRQIRFRVPALPPTVAQNTGSMLRGVRGVSAQTSY